MLLTEADQTAFHQICSAACLAGKSRLGVAVSGGSDSVALLYLMYNFSTKNCLHLEAATVNHNLRPEAADEAAYVADMCRELGIGHTTLSWEGWNKSGNLQNEARRARYQLLADWATTRGLETVALGHTSDDQAETFLMRLARSAGADGLAAMQPEFTRYRANFCRPALALGRSELRAFLQRHSVMWKDDPSNMDPTYERVKARNALPKLAELDIDAGRLNAVAQNLRIASDALRHYTAKETERAVTQKDGDLIVDRAYFLFLPQDIQHRILTRALLWIAGGDYAPRGTAIQDLRCAIKHHKARTLYGCLLTCSDTDFRLSREHNAVKNLSCETTAVWDGRWQFSGPHDTAYNVTPLGDVGLKQIEDWRQSEHPRNTLKSSPAVWHGDALIAAPLAGLPNGWRATLTEDRADFQQFLESH